jgi:hypothetical protein
MQIGRHPLDFALLATSSYNPMGPGLTLSPYHGGLNATVILLKSL